MPREKAAVRALESKGLVTVRRTTEKTAGLLDWWIKLTPEGAKVAGELFG